MPVPTKPNERRIRHEGDFTWEQFAKDCLLNKYALVVGSEAILNRDINPEAAGDSTKLLFDETLYYKASLDLLEEYPETNQAVSENEIMEEFQHLKRRYKNFSQLDRKVKNIKELVFSVIKNKTDNDGANIDTLINPLLMQLLQTHCFRIVITTAIDPYLEMAMEKVWGPGGFDVVQIENAQQSFKHVAYDEFDLVRPTLCYLFGKINTKKSLSENKFVLSENDAIAKIATWFESKNNNKFLTYLHNKRLLSIGSKFDDWMFRFFWYLIRGQIGTMDDGQVAVEIKNDDNLVHYLEQERVKVFPDASDFMQRAVAEINAATNIDLLPRKENGVFICYAHEDRYIALPLFERLHSASVNVWIDEEKLEGGAEYEQRIRHAINSCKVFMPILSSQVKYDMTSDKQSERWYYQEWLWAQSRHDEEKNISIDGQALFKVIPIVVGDYRFNEDYHQQLPPCIIGATAFEMAKDNIEHLIRLINT